MESWRDDADDVVDVGDGSWTLGLCPRLVTSVGAKLVDGELLAKKREPCGDSDWLLLIGVDDEANVVADDGVSCAVPRLGEPCAANGTV